MLINGREKERGIVNVTPETNDPYSRGFPPISPKIGEVQR
jgi:hypothetical protein